MGGPINIYHRSLGLTACWRVLCRGCPSGNWGKRSVPSVICEARNKSKIYEHGEDGVKFVEEEEFLHNSGLGEMADREKEIDISMPRPVSAGSSQPQTLCMMVALTLAAAAVVAARPEEKHQNFISCSGWGPSCTMHMPGGGDVMPVVSISRPAPRREAAPLHRIKGVQRGIPSIVTSGGWEPGTMGKRRPDTDVDFRRDLLELLSAGAGDRNAAI
ncbi:hypothetical protein Btru_028068 [Bulinus truncatus]|nr:hypothetical protein Btru_028068 [Bulinus truncatus]